MSRPPGTNSCSLGTSPAVYRAVLRPVGGGTGLNRTPGTCLRSRRPLGHCRAASIPNSSSNPPGQKRFESHNVVTSGGEVTRGTTPAFVTSSIPTVEAGVDQDAADDSLQREHRRQVVLLSMARSSSRPGMADHRRHRLRSRHVLEFWVKWEESAMIHLALFNARRLSLNCGI